MDAKTKIAAIVAKTEKACTIAKADFLAAIMDGKSHKEAQAIWNTSFENAYDNLIA
jgi:hypothetical protein